MAVLGVPAADLASAGTKHDLLPPVVDIVSGGFGGVEKGMHGIRHRGFLNEASAPKAVATTTSAPTRVFNPSTLDT